ncbi:retrovirus-related pol polyprotein from transposon TNT 1-94 [Tanacetum coccineum]
MVEHARSSSKSNFVAKGKGKKKNDKKGKGKVEHLAPKARIVKQKFQRTCCNCDQPGHRAANYKMPKRVNPRQANMVDDNIDMISMVSDVIAMISEVNLVGSNNSGWWVDTGVTHHVCADKSMFHYFRAVDNGEKLYMGNSATADIKGKIDVILKMTSEKELKLTNVMYVPEIRKNLVSGWLLNKFGFPFVFDSDKFVLSRNQMCVGRGYAVNAKVVVRPKSQKIGPKSVDCIFIGYANNSSAYRFIVHDSKNLDIQKNAIMESRNASFFENIFTCLTKETGSSSRLDDEVVQDKRQRDDNELHDERLDQLEEEEVELRRSKRARTEKSFGPDFVSFTVENEPTSYRQAVTSSEGYQWKEAIKSEIDSILQNHTWELVDLPPGCKPLGYKWIFKKKMKANGTIDKYKERLVIKGYRQRERLDYFDTYSPVMRITSIRTVLAIAALRNLDVHQMDVKMAFINGDLEEEIYMNQPEGFIALGQESKICRLVKSLYGLKQAPKQWHQKFDHTMLESGFKINECDKCVYVKDTSSGYVILCLYVDDMLIIGSNDKMIKSTKDMLKSKFDMKDMGLADVILGIKIIRTHNGLVLSTRPDLAYAVSRLSRYTSNPSDAHWKAMTRVLHYLRYSRDYGLHYDRYPAVIEGYSDANWISDIKDSRSTSGYVFTLGGAAISWKSSKQTVIAKSMMESEFIALDKCGEEAEWLRQFVEDIPRWPKPTTTAKELWESLERKYKTEDASTKKFVVARFLDYKMGDSKTMITQVQDLQDFATQHKRKEMSVEDMVVHLRIEEGTNQAGSNNSGWWVDTRATRHVCADKSLFSNLLVRLSMVRCCTWGISAIADITTGQIRSWFSENDIRERARVDYCLVCSEDSKDGSLIGNVCLYKTEVENQLGQKNQVVRSDRDSNLVLQKEELYLDRKGTRPDLAYAVSRLSRYPAIIEGYNDANWISDIKDSRSTSRYVFTLGGAAISWKSSKKTVIAKFMMELEFIALDKCGEEAEWLRQFVKDIPRWPKLVTAISIHCDSQSAIGRAHSTMYNGKSRHIRRIDIIRYDNYSQQELSQSAM